MTDDRRVFVYRTPNLLAKPFWKQGEPCYDSLIKVLAGSKESANNKFNEYVKIGQRIGFYK